MTQITIRNLINIVIILLSLVFVQAEKERFVKITNINNGNPVIPGEKVPVRIKIIHTPSESDTSFDLIFKDEGNKVFEKIATIDSKVYQFNKENEYNIEGVAIPNVSDGDYKIYGYIGEEKVSDSYTVKVQSAETTSASSTTESKSPESTNVTETDKTNTSVPVSPTVTEAPAPSETQNSSATATNQANVSTAGSIGNNDKKSSFNWKSVLIIAAIAIVILIIFGILFYCCIKDSRKDRDNSIYNLPPSVSEPQLVSSSSPINAIPLRYGNNSSGNSSNININNNNPFTSPIIHSNSNYSDGYNPDTQGLTSKRVRQIQQPAEAYSRDTIYSSNSAYVSQDSMASPEDDMSSPSPSYYFQVFKPHQVYRVLYDFQPSLPDEMEIQAGDIIRTEETFEDGWAYGINMTSGKRGTFPMNCLEDDFATEGDSKSVISERSQSRSKRTSSLPNNQNAQAVQMMLKNNPNQSQSFQKSYYISQANNMKV